MISLRQALEKITEIEHILKKTQAVIIVLIAMVVFQISLMFRQLYEGTLLGAGAKMHMIKNLTFYLDCLL